MGSDMGIRKNYKKNMPSTKLRTLRQRRVSNPLSAVSRGTPHKLV